ncbi:hypothetical protein THAOC_00444 [Thalassiosira oceanica]|uniref:Uncharacterized protein n=1 Tax=Thalassiosira oceanica TaxID=159749 RepID=K0TP81_THAOC|nr:hypothetical protein THAOC_00444 [Thalassiosira oceanica]|eukprot:EJK77706.1 hypothetical protein THAOC_00444 [Thalassiosira oceanica]
MQQAFILECSPAGNPIKRKQIGHLSPSHLSCPSLSSRCEYLATSADQSTVPADAAPSSWEEAPDDLLMSRPTGSILPDIFFGTGRAPCGSLLWTSRSSDLPVSFDSSCVGWEVGARPAGSAAAAGLPEKPARAEELRRASRQQAGNGETLVAAVADSFDYELRCRLSRRLGRTGGAREADAEDPLRGPVPGRVRDGLWEGSINVAQILSGLLAGRPADKSSAAVQSVTTGGCLRPGSVRLKGAAEQEADYSSRGKGQRPIQVRQGGKRPEDGSRPRAPPRGGRGYGVTTPRPPTRPGLRDENPGGRLPGGAVRRLMPFHRRRSGGSPVARACSADEREGGMHDRRMTTDDGLDGPERSERDDAGGEGYRRRIRAESCCVLQNHRSIGRPRTEPPDGGSTHAQRRSGTSGRVGSRWLRSGKPPVRWIRCSPSGEAGREIERHGGCTGETQSPSGYKPGVGRMRRQTAERLTDRSSRQLSGFQEGGRLPPLVGGGGAESGRGRGVAVMEQRAEPAEPSALGAPRGVVMIGTCEGGKWQQEGQKSVLSQSVAPGRSRTKRCPHETSVTLRQLSPDSSPGNRMNQLRLKPRIRHGNRDGPPDTPLMKRRRNPMLYAML